MRLFPGRRPCKRHYFSFLRSCRRHLLIILAATAAAGFLASGTLQARAAASTEGVCGTEFDAAASELRSVTLPGCRQWTRVWLDVNKAMTWFRFHRRSEALPKLESALKILSRPTHHRNSNDKRQRERAKAAVTALQSCIATAQAPGWATLTVHTFEFDENAPQSRRRPAGAGVYVRVDDTPVGRTGSDGTLTVPVPSGALQVTALVPSTSIGDASVTLPPGGSGTVSIVLHDGKEVAEETDLVLAEAVDDIVPVTSTSFTLQFMRDDVPVPVRRIDHVERLDRFGNFDEDLDELFTVVGGALTATDPASLFRSMAARFAETITLRVQAVDAAGFTHANEVRFRVGQFKLLVTLAPPPSNPDLSVSNVEVLVSVIGTGITLSRVSDLQGRFEIESLPDATIGFYCETISGGLYYYGNTTMTVTSDRSVTLVLRHVKDIVAGVAPLRVNR
jgi:hypothetical protein